MIDVTFEDGDVANGKVKMSTVVKSMVDAMVKQTGISRMEAEIEVDNMIQEAIRSGALTPRIEH